MKVDSSYKKNKVLFNFLMNLIQSLAYKLLYTIEYTGAEREILDI